MLIDLDSSLKQLRTKKKAHIAEELDGCAMNLSFFNNLSNKKHWIASQMTFSRRPYLVNSESITF